MTSLSFHPKIIIRTPRLPFNENLSFSKIEALLYDATFLESIYLASPELYKECVKFRNGEKIDDKTKAKLRVSLSKYYSRSISRCTPFGLFSGCAVSEWSHHSKVIIQKQTERHTRLDMHYLCALAQELSKKKYIQKHLLFHTNNSVYDLGSEIRYIEYKYLSGRRIHQISAVEKIGNIEQVLEEARTGITISQIKAILALPEVDDYEIDAFIQEILEAQLLVSELEPAITGEEFIHQILKTLKRVCLLEKKTELIQIIHVLENTCQKLIEIDNRPYNDTSAYDEIMASLNKLGVSIEAGKLFQTDLIRRVASGGITLSLQEDLLAAINIMNQFSTSLINENSNLRDFITRFYNRYEDQEVSLLEALDTESGIGYMETSAEEDTPLLQDILLPDTESNIISYRWSRVEEFLQQKLITYYKNDDTIITLKDEELTFLKSDWGDLPPSLHVLFRIIGKNNDKIYVESCGGSSGINLLARFAHADKGIEAICADIARKEEEYNPDIAFAEIVHLPESRTGNILLHPAFRKYEIPYLSKSSLPSTKQILLQDLLISVKNGEIVLRSRKLNKRIVPRLSNAHNYTSDFLPVYQFLCELQTNGLKRKIGFSWGIILQQHKMLPRVEYKNVVLSPAMWKLSKEDFSGILEKEDELSFFLNKYNIPQQIVLADGDNELFVNFNNPDSIKVFRKTISRRESIELKEFFDTGNLVQDEEANYYTNQVLATLLNSKKTYDVGITGVNTPPVKNGIFPFGTEWLYYKIYCGEKSADKILTDVVKPLVSTLIKEKLISNFFFIRYTDPDLHLRIRLKLTAVDNMGSVATKVQNELNPLFKSGHISNIQLDTYKQELNRYGSSSIELSEELFFHNSTSILEMLALTWGDERESLRWLWAMRAIDELLITFDYSLEKKLRIIENLKDSFAKEFKMNKSLKEQLNEKYRTNRKNIEQILDYSDADQMNSDIIKSLLSQSEKVKKIADQLKELDRIGKLEVPIYDLLISYIHMLINRVTISKPRQHELIIYNFLYRYYKSQLSKQF